MLNHDQGHLDLELISIVTQAEQCLVEVEEMPSRPDTSELDQFANDVVSVPSCGDLAAILPSPVRPGLGNLLGVALSEDFNILVYVMVFRLGPPMLGSACSWVVGFANELIFPG